ncbi:MAG: hypothetical protein SAL70_33410 [Scytonema sp. PMC 1070.18]|nr:hypothetical protein [Scytonema sp. PMC 1070.18]
MNLKNTRDSRSKPFGYSHWSSPSQKDIPLFFKAEYPLMSG